jgi:hypothetical protein
MLSCPNQQWQGLILGRMIRNATTIGSARRIGCAGFAQCCFEKRPYADASFTICFSAESEPTHCPVDK